MKNYLKYRLFSALINTFFYAASILFNLLCAVYFFVIKGFFTGAAGTDFFNLFFFHQLHKGLADKTPGADGTAVFLFLCHNRLHSLKTIRIRFSVGFPNSRNNLVVVRKLQKYYTESVMKMQQL